MIYSDAAENLMMTDIWKRIILTSKTIWWDYKNAISQLIFVNGLCNTDFPHFEIIQYLFDPAC